MTPFEIILIILIILFLGAIVAWQVVKHVRKAKGKSTGSSCGCDCGGCSAKNCPSKNTSKYYGNDVDDVMPEVNVQSNVTCDFSDLIEKEKEQAEETTE